MTVLCGGKYIAKREKLSLLACRTYALDLLISL